VRGQGAARVAPAHRGPRTDPAGLFPAHLRRSIAVLMFAAELSIAFAVNRHRLRRQPAYRRPAIRTAVLDADTDEVLATAGTRESAVL
jgi:hypothetical protein